VVLIEVTASKYQRTKPLRVGCIQIACYIDKQHAIFSSFAFNLFGVDHLQELMTEHSSLTLNLVISYICSTAVLHICDECLPFPTDVFHCYYYLTTAPKIYTFLKFTSGRPYISMHYFQLAAVVRDELRCSEQALGVKTRSLTLTKHGSLYTCYILYQVTANNQIVCVLSGISVLLTL
jgi:hypothetical protein